MAILIGNVVRLSGLALIQYDAPAYFQVANGIGANAIFYLSVFALWVLWARLEGDISLTPRQLVPAA